MASLGFLGPFDYHYISGINSRGYCLEVTYQMSKNGGLAESSRNKYVRYLWRIVPTAILTVIATLFNMLDFQVQSLESYRVLHRGDATAKQSIFRNSTGKTPVEAIFEGFRFRQKAVAATALSALLAPFLTIVASGLFVEEFVSSTHTRNLVQTSWFNGSDNSQHGDWSGSLSRGREDTIISLI